MTETSATPLEYASPANKPQVVIWYKVYCVGMAVMYALIAVLGGWLLATDAAQEDRLLWIVMTAICAPLVMIYLAGTLVPRSKPGWICGIVLIAIGMSGCTLVAAVPLLIFWVNERTRAWFRM